MRVKANTGMLVPLRLVLGIGPVEPMNDLTETTVGRIIDSLNFDQLLVVRSERSRVIH